MHSLKNTTVSFTHTEDDSQHDTEVLPFKEATVTSVTDRERSLRHKYDRRILPLGTLIYLIAQIDRSNMSNAVVLRSTAVRNFALFLTTAAAFTTSPILLAWVVSNSAGPSVLAIVAAYAVGEGNLGAIIATWTYLPKDEPSCVTGHWINFGAACILMIVIAVTTMYLRWENVMRAKGRRDYRLTDENVEAVEKLGHSHPEYRYTE